VSRQQQLLPLATADVGCGGREFTWSAVAGNQTTEESNHFDENLYILL